MNSKAKSRAHSLRYQYAHTSDSRKTFHSNSSPRNPFTSSILHPIPHLQIYHTLKEDKANTQTQSKIFFHSASSSPQSHIPKASASPIPLSLIPSFLTTLSTRFPHPQNHFVPALRTLLRRRPLLLLFLPFQFLDIIYNPLDGVLALRGLDCRQLGG